MVPRIRAEGAPTSEDILAANLAALESIRSELAEIRKGGNGGGNKASNAVLRIFVALAIALAAAAFGFAWDTNAATAVHTEQIEQLGNGVRDLREEFVKENTRKLESLDNRLRAVEQRR